MTVHRDSLYNVLLNVSELKVENLYLLKKNANQKLIISSKDVILTETDFKVAILTKQIREEEIIGTKKWWDGFGKGAATGGLIALIITLL